MTKRARKAAPKKAANGKRASTAKKKPPPRPPVDEPLLRVRRNGQRGRPTYTWTDHGLQTFADLLYDGNKLETVAKIFRVSLSWLEKQITLGGPRELDYGEHGARCDARLMAAMFRSAEAGNAVSQIWLSKHRLGWRDFRALEVTGADGGPLEVQSEIKPLLEQKLKAFLRSKENREAVRGAGSKRARGNGPDEKKEAG